MSPEQPRPYPSRTLLVTRAVLIGAGGMMKVLVKASCLAAALLVSAAVAIPAANAAISATNVQRMSGWLTCGNCGNTGGSGATASYSMTRGIRSPSMTGAAARFAIGGSRAFKNAYWYRPLGRPSSLYKRIVYDFYLYVPPSSATAPQAVEFEVQQTVAGWTYNLAWQADYASRQWRVFNYSARRWESVGLGFAGFSAGKWHHIVAEFATAGHTAIHTALTVDGARHYINRQRSAVHTGQSAHFNNAFQLDLNRTATDYHVYVDRMTITAN